MKLLILGFYNRNNLGDEMFKETIPLLFPNCECDFWCTDDFNIDINKYDGIVCGGGDIVNDYFHNTITEHIKYYKKNIFAVGIGIPYPNLIDEGYLDIYDHVFIRERTDLLKIQRRLGSQYVHYLPDLGFLKISENSLDNILDTKKKIGLFLIGGLIKYPNIIYTLSRFVEEIGKEYQIIFYRFDTSGDKEQDDMYVNNMIYESLKDICTDMINDTNRYNSDMMIEQMSKLDFAICMRFHSHIFATITGCPFLSIYTTRKDKLYITEENYDKWAYEVELNEQCEPMRIDYNNLKNKFRNVVNDSKIIKEKLLFIKDKYRNLLNTKQPYYLIRRLNKRPKYNYHFENKSVIDIYNDAKKLIEKLTGYDVDKGIDDNIKIISEHAYIIAESICTDITGMPSNKYVYGTHQNIMSFPWKLKEMIKWMFEDYSKEYFLSCNRINLNYYCQDGFKGLHRSGWQYAIDFLQSLNCNNGVLCDSYLDRTFHWSSEIMYLNGHIPYTSPWIGFVHHTFENQYTNYNCDNLIQNPLFIRSLITCRGIICLSEYLSRLFNQKLLELGYSIPILTLYHPTSFIDNVFNYDKFINNKEKKLINVGAWYRNPFSIYTIEVDNIFTKKSLEGKSMENYFKPDNFVIYHQSIENNGETNKWVYYLFEYIKSQNYFINEFNMSINDIPIDFCFNLDDSSEPSSKYEKLLKNHINKLLYSVQKIKDLNNIDYDELLSQNIVFLNLIDCSAANTIIECIVRNTPILVNKLDPVVEYLGKDYPFYYNNLSEIKNLLTFNNINKTTLYLQNMNKNYLRIENFIHNFKNNLLYTKLLN